MTSQKKLQNVFSDGYLQLIFYVVLVIYIAWSYIVLSFSNNTLLKQTNISQNTIGLKEYNYPIHFNPFPDHIPVGDENTFPCNTDDLRKCSMSDASSCFGCANLTARCVHFKEDVEFIKFSQDMTSANKTIIPRHVDADEGYCLNFVSLNERCNPFHGKLALVELAPPNSNAYTGRVALICLCNNAYITNITSILGACEDVQICQGKVKNLNVPFDQIQCDCPEGYFTERLINDQNNELPYCSPDNVSFHDYNKDVKTYKSENAYVSKDIFNDDYKNSISSTLLPNPCATCALTGKPVKGRVIEIGGQYSCASEDNTCLPIRLSTKGRILKGLDGPDGMIALKWSAVNLFGYFDSVRTMTTAIRFNVAPGVNEDIAKLMNLSYNKNKNNEFVMNTMSYGLIFPIHFISRIDTFGIVSSICCTRQEETNMCAIVDTDGRNTTSIQNDLTFKTFPYVNVITKPLTDKKNNYSYSFIYTDNNVTNYLSDDSRWILDNFNPLFKIEKDSRGYPSFMANKHLMNPTTETARNIGFLYFDIRINSNTPRGVDVRMVTTSDQELYKKYVSEVVIDF